MSETTPPEVIAVSFQKGGTGKTFTALNLAGGLAARGFDVLLIDLDPQGSLTANLGKREVYEDIDQLSLDNVLLDVNKWSQINEIILSDHEEFDLIPSNTTFNGNKTPLDSADAGENRLGKVIEKIDHDYHFIVCDCPPDLSAYSKNAVTAGENVIVPMQPRSEMIHSANLLFDHYETLGMMHSLEIEYLAFTMTYDSTKLTKEKRKVIDWFEDTFDEKGVLVDDRAAFDRAKWNQASIYTHSEAVKNDQFPVFDQVVQLVLEQTSPPDHDVDLEHARNMSTEELRDRIKEAPEA
jgi:chromosome partitioning protein